MKKIILIFCFVFLFSFVSSVTLNQGVVLNTSVSNSSINFSSSFNVSSFFVDENYILLNDINFTNSTGSYNCSDLNYSSENLVLDSSEFNCTLLDVVSDEEEDEEVVLTGGGSSYFVLQGDDFKEGIIKNIRENYKINFKVEDQIHILTLKKRK